MKINQLLTGGLGTGAPTVSSSLSNNETNPVFKIATEPSLINNGGLVQQVAPSMSYSQVKLNSVVGAGIKITNINNSSPAIAKPLVLKSFILPNQQQQQQVTLVSPKSITPPPPPPPPLSVPLLVDTQTNTKLVNKLSEMSENVKAINNATPLVKIAPAISTNQRNLTPPRPTNQQPPTIVLKMKTQNINQLIPQIPTVTSSSFYNTTSTSFRNTIRCLLDPSNDFSRKINERVLPSASSVVTKIPKTTTALSCLNIPQTKPSTINLMTSSVSSNGASVGSNLAFHPKNHEILISKNNKKSTTQALSTIPTSSNTHQILADDTKMGPHESFVFDLGLSLVQNYIRPEENAVAKEFAYELKHKCPTCDFKCDTELIMDTHLTEPHTFATFVKCFYCEGIFNLHVEYRRHMRMEHNRSCKLEKPFNKNAQCTFCDFECASGNNRRGRTNEKLKDHIEIDCPFSKMHMNTSKKNLLQNLQAPSYIDCLSSAHIFNKKSLGGMCADKYGDFKFYSSFKNLDSPRMNLLNNIKLLESILGNRSQEKKANKTVPAVTATTLEKLRREECHAGAESDEPVAKKLKPSIPSQIMCDLCQVMFINNGDNTSKLLALLRDHLYKFHMIKNINQLDNIVERAYLKLLGVNGTVTVGVPPPVLKVPSLPPPSLPKTVHTTTTTDKEPYSFIPKTSQERIQSNTDIPEVEMSSDEEEDNDATADIIHIENPNEQSKSRGITASQKLEIINFHVKKPHLRQTELIYFFEKKFNVKIAKSTMSDLLNGKSVAKLYELHSNNNKKEQTPLQESDLMKNYHLRLHEIKQTKLEEQLLRWLNGEQAKCSNDNSSARVPLKIKLGNITDEMIIAKAKEFGKYLRVPAPILLSFNTKWLENFKKRFNVLDAITKVVSQPKNEKDDGKEKLSTEDTSKDEKKIADEILPEMAQKPDVKVSLTSSTNNDNETVKMSFNLKQEQQLVNKTEDKVDYAKNLSSSREKSKNILYYQLQSRMLNLNGILVSTRTLEGLAKKIEEEIFKKTPSLKLDYVASIKSTLEKIKGISEIELLKIFRGKICFESESYTKFIALSKKYEPTIEAPENDERAENKLSSNGSLIKCDYCDFKLMGTNILYQRHLIANHMKQPEIKLRKIDGKVMDDLLKKSPVKSTRRL